MFRMNGYVQDERYAAGAGMRRSGFFQTGTVSWMCGAIVSGSHGLHFDVRRDCVNFALDLRSRERAPTN
jgi:hypothetical protein